MRTFILVSTLATLSLSASAQAPDTVFAQELTWTQIRDGIEVR